jgi:hypothetical protein
MQTTLKDNSLNSTGTYPNPTALLTVNFQNEIDLHIFKCKN